MKEGASEGPISWLQLPQRGLVHWMQFYLIRFNI